MVLKLLGTYDGLEPEPFTNQGTTYSLPLIILGKGVTVHFPAISFGSERRIGGGIIS